MMIAIWIDAIAIGGCVGDVGKHKMNDHDELKGLIVFICTMTIMFDLLRY